MARGLVLCKQDESLNVNDDDKVYQLQLNQITMGIVYVTTHLMMAICITGILYFALKPDMGISSQQKLPVSEGFYARGLKLIVVVATTTYRIAMGILVTYLK